MLIDLEFVLLVCAIAAIIVGVWAFFGTGNAGNDDIESLTLEIYKKGVQEKLRDSLLSKRASLSQAVKILSREEFREMIKEGVAEGMAEELSESECEQAHSDLELQQTISDITDSVYDELSQDKV